MRKWPLLLLVVLVGCLVPSIASAKTDGEKQAAFVLKSEILSQVPEIASAHARVEADPTDALAWRGLGQALANRGAFGDAVRALESASKIAEKDPNVWVDLGATYIRAGEPSKGLSALKHALTIEPFFALAHYDMGIAHQALGQYDAALDSFEYALTIDPSLGDPKKNPGVAVNHMLPYVKTRLYMKSTGNAFAIYSPLQPAAASGAAMPSNPPGDAPGDQVLTPPLDNKTAPPPKPAAKPAPKPSSAPPDVPNF